VRPGLPRLDLRARRGIGDAVDFGLGSGAMGLGLGAVVGLALGCGARTDPLLAIEQAPLELDGGEADATTEDTSPPMDAAAATDRNGEPSDASPNHASTTGDADSATAEGPDARCGPSTCSGCCRSNGSCVAPENETAAFCGNGGDLCIACPPEIACDLDTTDGTRVCGHFL
jgi:hypothetical protein